MTSTRSHRFLTLGFMISVAMCLLAVSRVMATGLIVQECTSCTSLAAFQSEAYSTPIPASAYSGNRMSVLFEIVNPGAYLLASISVQGFCISTADGAPCTWNYDWTDDTNSMAELEQAFAISAPSQAVQIPASVASTFTGTVQASAVSAWLVQESTGYTIPPGTVFLTIFPDGSSAEYQITGTNPLTYSFVSNTGHAADGDPENDSGQLVSAPTFTPETQPVTFDPKKLLAQIAWSQRVNSSTLGAHLSEMGGTASLSSVLGLCTNNNIDSCTAYSDLSSANNIGPFQFTQAAIVGNSGFPTTGSP